MSRKPKQMTSASEAEQPFIPQVSRGRPPVAGMGVTFIGDQRDGAHNPKSLLFGDVTFPLNERVTIGDPEWIAKFGSKVRGNSHFLVG